MPIPEPITVARFGSHDFPSVMAPLLVKDEIVQGKPVDIHHVLCPVGILGWKEIYVS